MLFHTMKSFTVEHPLKDADVVFLGIPSSEGSLSSTSNFGPLIVRESLKLMEDYDGKNNIFSSLKVCDVGDVEVVPGSYQLTAKRIRETIKDIKNENPSAFIIAIGGNHLISLPLVEALKPKTVVQLDAHADLRSSYLGNKFMQQTWAYHASKIAKIILVGTRTWNKEEKEYAKRNGIECYTVEEFAKKSLDLKDFHLSIDVDIFDPAYVETGLPETNGATPEQIIKIIEALPKPTSMDITEIADNKLPSKTGFLAGKLILKVLEKLVKKY